jgi:hypothetical protein
MQTADRLSGPVSTAPGVVTDVDVTHLENNALIIRLHFTVNHLSRWITPVHDRIKLVRSVRRDDPSVKDLLIQMRNEELRVFPKMHLIATRNNPNLDKFPEWEMTPEQEQLDREASAIEILAEFRRLRQSTCSLLRSLPDNAWSRVGTSRREHDWQIRTLAEHLARHDVVVLRQMDETLDRVGAREGISPAARARLDEVLRLAPVTVKQ